MRDRLIPSLHFRLTFIHLLFPSFPRNDTSTLIFPPSPLARPRCRLCLQKLFGHARGCSVYTLQLECLLYVMSWFGVLGQLH
jgi:hypothetical protein